MKTLLMHAPVVHKGYQQLITRLNPSRILIMSDAVTDQFDKRRKDIRALQASEIVAVLRIFYPAIDIQEFNKGTSFKEDEEIHLPDEDISDDVVGMFLSNKNIVRESVFLRYDSKKSKAQEEVVPDRIVSKDDPSLAVIIAALQSDANNSPDWWRQVSTAVVKDGKILSLQHNVHAPRNSITGILGDPRSNATKGVATNISKAAHSEPLACFLAGVEGCKGADLFASTFPCPQCANFISFTGIKSLFFVEGYAMLDGAQDLRDAGIEIVKVQ